MRSRRAMVLVEVRFEAEASWRRHTSCASVLTAVRVADQLMGIEVNQWPNYAFPNVRVRYRGITLALWRMGGFVR